jgi:hypothetical protein
MEICHRHFDDRRYRCPDLFLDCRIELRRSVVACGVTKTLSM